MGMRAADLAPIPHDPDRAMRLFEEARTQGPLLLRTPRLLPEGALEITQAVAADLGRCGIATRIEIEEDRPAYARQVGQKRIGDVAIGLFEALELAQPVRLIGVRAEKLRGGDGGSSSQGPSLRDSDS
jgi:hypothetical protein